MDAEAIDGAYLERAKTFAPLELQPFYSKARELYNKKLWYQLTVAVEAFLENPVSANDNLRSDLYDHFISSFTKKINPLRLVGIAIVVSKQYSDPSTALRFLNEIAEKVDIATTQEAFVFATMEAAHFQLVLGDLDGTKTAMEKCGKILEGFDSVETRVHASYYRVSGDYYKVNQMISFLQSGIPLHCS